MTRRKSVHDLAAFKGAEHPLVCLTAYTAPIARLADAYADMLLVGDSLGMVIYGFPSTLPVTMDMMIAHGRAVVSSSSQAFVCVDMPFGSYQQSPEQAFANAARIMADTGCGAVKLEGGSEMAQTVSFLSARGIPVIGHIGLQPQSVNTAGGYRVTGKTEGDQIKLIEDARVLARAGAVALVLECMRESAAAAVTGHVEIPTIGIGASAACDGQVLVSDDLLGLTPGPHPRFVKQYADMADVVGQAFSDFARDVRARDFPAPEQTYTKESAPVLTARRLSSRD